jgi:integrase
MYVPVIITSDGILQSYLEYTVYHKDKSDSWRQQSVRAMSLLLDYVEANAHNYRYPTELFTAFSNSLFTGTIDKTGDDQSGLRWYPLISRQANSHIRYITHYTDWLAIKKGNDNLRLNPWREATTYERKLNWAAYSQKHDRAFLAHTWDQQVVNESMSRSRNVRARINPSGGEVMKRFPESKINDLLFAGFTKPKALPQESEYKRLQLRDLLITILMHFGSVRNCEPFHLWIEDVMEHPEDPEEALIRIYQPETGLSPLNHSVAKNEIRQTTLARKFGMIPRNKYPKSKRVHAGWKEPRLDDARDQYMELSWFEPSAGKLFMLYWKLYLKHQRVKSGSGASSHPFAFTNDQGDPYSVKEYSRKHGEAVKKIGLVPAQSLGTTPHGHRHAFAYRVKSSGLDGLYISRAMNHKSVESKNVYLDSTTKEIRAQFNQAEGNLNNRNMIADKLKNKDEDADE